MSHLKASQELAKTIASSVRGPRLFQGELVGGDDQWSIIHCQRLWFSVIWDAQTRFSVELNRGRFLQLTELINEVDVFELLSLLDEFDGLLLASTRAKVLRRSLKKDLRHAARICMLQYGGFTARLLGLLSHVVDKWSQMSEPTALGFLHQVFAFQGRLPLKCSKTSAVAMGTWWACELRSVYHDFNCDPERAVISEWFSKVKNPLDDPTKFFPSHPSGATMETSKMGYPKTVAGKYSAFDHMDEKLLKVLCRLGYLDSDANLLDEYCGLMQNPFGQLRITNANGTIRSVRLIDLVEVTSEFNGVDIEGPQGTTRINVKKQYQKWFSNCNVLQSVPKSWKTDRIISMETALRMWLQSGFKDFLFSILKKKMSPLAYHYFVTSDWCNAEKACEGSCTGWYTTTDLSSASDCVRHALTKAWFQDSCVAEILDLVRSDYTLVPVGNARLSKAKRRNMQKLRSGNEPVCDTELMVRGDYVKWPIKKEAPMGSAVCFPIEVIVFAAILEVIHRQHPGTFKEYFVYGDDMVHDTIIAHLVWARLTDLGFTPNIKKSFGNAPAWDEEDIFFRESCGAEWLNGVDVAPVRLSRKFSGFAIPTDIRSYFAKELGLRTAKNKSAKKGRSGYRPKVSRAETVTRINAEISLANRFYENNYTTARCYILDHLLRKCGLKIPFSRDNDAVLLSNSATNYHLYDDSLATVRFNFDTQVFETKALVPHVKIPKIGNLAEEVRLYENLRVGEHWRNGQREAFAERKRSFQLTVDDELRMSEPDTFNLQFELRSQWVEVELKESLRLALLPRLLVLQSQLTQIRQVFRV